MRQLSTGVLMKKQSHLNKITLFRGKLISNAGVNDDTLEEKTWNMPQCKFHFYAFQYIPCLSGFGPVVSALKCYIQDFSIYLNPKDSVCRPVLKNHDWGNNATRENVHTSGGPYYTKLWTRL